MDYGNCATKANGKEGKDMNHVNHIQEIPPDDGFYAIAWCENRLGMLDDYFSSVDTALKNQNAQLCPKCVEAIQHRLYAKANGCV